MSKPVIFIVGPTGSGKSKLALILARKLKADILSADSMQVYRGMNIGTAKPTKKEQKLIRHHLLDLISPRAECSVFKYCKLALASIQKVMKQNRLSIVVGGSGFYIKALIEGLSPMPGKQAQSRKKLEELNTHDLHDRLKKLDPDLAKKIHVNNKKKIIRTIEIMSSPHPSLPPQGGKGDIDFSISSPFMGEDKGGGLSKFEWKPIIFGLERDRAELYERIEKRVDQMFAAGWIQEVKKIKRVGFSKTARYAIGYKEILEYLEAKKNLEETKFEIKKRTRHLAKKQLTWFRRDPNIQWYFVSGEKYSPVISKILKDIQPSFRRARRATKPASPAGGQSKTEIASLTLFARNDTGN